jgi:3-oxoacyl-[acyl-carrier protein] reductase
MNDILKNQTAIVTGGTAGIGKAIAKTFIKYGARVAILGTNRERGMQVLEEIGMEGNSDRALFFKANVSSLQEVQQAIMEATHEFNHIDILVNNAGITRDQLLVKMNEKDWDDVMTTNVKSCYNTCHSLIRSMIKAKRGKIINISSVVGLTGNAGQVNYSASKAAIIGFSKALAKELASRNICVNCIAPGFILTRMTEILTEEQKTEILTQIPLRRMGSPEDIANMALFLASSLSDYITGQVFSVDGGMS